MKIPLPTRKFIGKKKLTRKGALLLLAVLLLALFTVDTGLNSGYFIRRDLNAAFAYRVTGDCEAFARYARKDAENWEKACEDNKGAFSGKEAGIKDFAIKRISHALGSGKAFAQMEIVKNTSQGETRYLVNYDLSRDKGTWKIDQDHTSNY